eukprot:TRINITY_DN49516_c0_g1_i1.p1 TRINITY_DN49516_c0_g1~~TRINITY_DN49516_c0_g1_i1.p1  ORF type:complete len:658 (-),score=95.76 TRINITY_DN49516_c0_g1_i1:153-2126(-)
MEMHLTHPSHGCQACRTAWPRRWCRSIVGVGLLSFCSRVLVQFPPFRRRSWTRITQVTTMNTTTITRSNSPTKTQGGTQEFELLLDWLQGASSRQTRRHSQTMSLASTMNEKAPEWLHLQSTIDHVAGHMKKGKYAINPNSHMRLPWEVAGLILLVFDAMAIPLVMAFELSTNIGLQIMNLMTMSYWTCDLWASFFVGYYSRSQTLIMDVRKTAWRYFRTWFCIDLFIVSLDYVLLLGSDSGGLRISGLARLGRAFRVLRVFRALKLLRVAKFNETMTVVLERIDSEQLRDIIDMAKYVFIILFVNHFVACGWYLLGRETDKTRNWLLEYDMLMEGKSYQYMTSLHWSLTQFTPASMSVQPQNCAERTYAVVVLLVAMCVFTSFVGSLTTKMTNIREASPINRKQVIQLRRYLRQHHISPYLAHRIQSYVSLTLWARSSCVQAKDVELLSILTGPLKRELETELVLPNIISNKLLKMLSEESSSVFSEVCSRVSNVSLAASDTFFQFGQKAEKICFLTRGVLCHWTGKEHKMMEPGGYFLEHPLWVTWWTRGRMDAISDCEVLTLDSAAFRSEVKANATTVFMILDYAHQYVRQLNYEEAEGQGVTDITKLHCPLDCPSGCESGQASVSTRFFAYIYKRLDSDKPSEKKREKKSRWS